MKVRNGSQGARLVVLLGVSAWLAGCSLPAGASTSATASSSANARPPASAPAQTSPAQGTGQSSPAVAGGDIRVVLDENSFPEEIKVKAGSKVVFVVNNKGQEEHTFELPDFTILREIKAGATARIEWTVPDKKGKWDVGCFLTDPPGVHDGMEGTLIIE